MALMIAGWRLQVYGVDGVYGDLGAFAEVYGSEEIQSFFVRLAIIMLIYALGCYLLSRVPVSVLFISFSLAFT